MGGVTLNATLRNLVFWIALLVVVGLVWNLSDRLQQGAKPLSFSEFMMAVDAAQVASVTITGSEISGSLKSNETFARLMDELAGTENRISSERGRYNAKIQEYNTTRRKFPSNITAGVFGFKEYPYFEAPKDSTGVPKVDFKK